MSASSPIWEMTKNQYSCEIIRPENFKQVMGAFSIALILSVPGTNLRICAFLQVVCAVETQFLPLCASWLELKTQAGLSKPQKKTFFHCFCKLCSDYEWQKNCSTAQSDWQKKRKAQIREKSHCDKKNRESATQRHPVPSCSANQLGQFQRRHLALRVWWTSGLLPLSFEYSKALEYVLILKVCHTPHSNFIC